MKIRTDFVTNSSSSSFATVLVDDIELAKDLGYSGTQGMNAALKKAVSNWYGIYGDYPPPFAAMTDLNGLLAILSLNDAGIEKEFGALIHEKFDDDDFLDYVFSYIIGEEYLNKLINQLKANQPHIFEKFSKTEGDINGLSFDIGYEEDGGWGPCVYVRIANGKRLTIVADETYNEDAYRGESLDGLQFLLLGDKEDYSSYDLIVECIQRNGGTVIDELTDGTNYAVYPTKQTEFGAEPAVEDEILKAVRAECVPIVSEKAFLYRWIDASINDIWHLSVEMRFSCEYLDWFEEYGYGRVTVEKWIGGEWRK